MNATEPNLCSRLLVRTVVPLTSQVLVALERTEAVTTGGIVVPENMRKETQWGLVLATGPEVEHVTPGDRVFTGKHDGTHYEENGVDLLFVKEAKILAVEPLTA